MDYKTPGVFVEEVALFPPSVAAVATAIPAFIGHTQFTEEMDGTTLINRPLRITSLLDFTMLFGGSFNPTAYTVQIDPAASFNIISTNPQNGRRYYLFDAIRHYFENGGGPCYIVSVGSYTQDVIYGTDTTGLRGGLRSLERVDEPTLLVAPDVVALRQGDGTPDFVQGGNLHKDMIAQCGTLQDRFAVLDLLEGYRAPNHASLPIIQFRNQSGTENLKYAASYYPWLCTTYLKDVHFNQLNFVDNQAIPVPVPDATINTMFTDPVVNALVTSMRGRLTEEQRVFSKVTAPVLTRANVNPLGDHLDVLRDAVMEATNAVTARPAFTAMMSFVRDLALSFRDLENDAGNPAEMTLLLTSLEANPGLRTALTNLIAFEKNPGVMNSIALARVVADVENDYASLNTEGWIGGVAVNTITADPADFTNAGGNSIAQTAQAAANATQLQASFNVIAQAYSTIANDAIFRTDQTEKILFTQHPFFKAVFDRIRKDMSLQPPSGAVAGIYAATDRSRGVWKAPANVSLRGVIAPSVKLTDQEQSTLNVHESGKSINALRAFTGKGILVWGARTLAGNDNEWRYVNVRRFFIFVEESVKKATEPFVFENNDAGTWIRVRAMIENFLTIQWRQGALTGATTKDAFFVKVGLGETMTSQDIQEGRMIVEIGMAAVRPAEFIILRFSHKMQES
jgi:phage tail sheath protein FI